MKTVIQYALAALLFAGAAGCSSAQKKVAPAAASSKTTTKTVQATSKTPESQGTICTNAEDVRKLVVEEMDKGCVLKYTKLGKTSDAATSHMGKTHCEEALTKIVKKLEASGFKCGE